MVRVAAAQPGAGGTVPSHVITVNIKKYRYLSKYIKQRDLQNKTFISDVTWRNCARGKIKNLRKYLII